MKMQLKYAPTDSSEKSNGDIVSVVLPPALPMEVVIEPPEDFKVPNIVARFPKALESYQKRRDKAIRKLASLKPLRQIEVIEQFINRHEELLKVSKEFFNQLDLNPTEARCLESLLLMLEQKAHCLRRIIFKKLENKDISQVVSHASFLQAYYAVVKADMSYNGLN